jgi:FPC/CPF motif-containing protein YcgG
MRSKMMNRLTTWRAPRCTRGIFVLANRYSTTSDKPLTTSFRSEVEATYGPATWQRQAYDAFKATLTSRSETFPCVYATIGYRNDNHRFVFLEASNLADPSNIRMLGPPLRTYLRKSHSLGPNTSIVIMCAPAEHDLSVEQYNYRFWDALRQLKESDPEPWPADVSHDIRSWQWSFHFDGTPVFPISLNPAYVQRRSRRMPVHIVSLQPKWVIDDLLGTPEKGQAAQDKVRKLLEGYDETPVHPSLTAYYEDENAVEGLMLGLPDDDGAPGIPYDSL